MKAIEFETRIDENGSIHVPEEFQATYGKQAHLVVQITEESESSQRGRQPGSAKGILRVISEDDDHLDDFPEYLS